MTGRPTIAEVARRAGVSVATVDRVLNRRRPVKPETARRVVEASAAVGYHATPLLARRARSLAPRVSLGFLLQKASKPFYQALAEELAARTRDHPEIVGEAVVRFVDELSPSAIVEAFDVLHTQVDALAIVSIDHPQVVDAVARIVAAGVPVFTLLSRITSRDVAGHISADARRGGRTAAWALARCAERPGEVGILIGSHRYLSHDDREIGFRSYFREQFPAFELLDAVVYLDDPTVSYGATAELLARRPGMVGLYLIGGGADGVLRALAEDGRPERVAFVCHEKTPATRRGLIEGTVDMVAATPLRRLARNAVDRLAKAARGVASPDDDIAHDIHVSETVWPLSCADEPRRSTDRAPQ